MESHGWSPLVGVFSSPTGQLDDPLALLAEVSWLSAGKLGGQMAPEAMGSTNVDFSL